MLMWFFFQNLHLIYTTPPSRELNLCNIQEWAAGTNIWLVTEQVQCIKQKQHKFMYITCTPVHRKSRSWLWKIKHSRFFMIARTWSLCWHCFKDITWETRKYTIYFSPNDLEWISVIEVKSAVFEDYIKMIHCFLSTKEGSTGFIKKIYRYSIFINVRKFPHLILKKFQTFSKLFIQHHIYI